MKHSGKARKAAYRLILYTLIAMAVGWAYGIGLHACRMAVQKIEKKKRRIWKVKLYVSVLLAFFA